MPLAIDLCCGRGGWTLGLLEAGWDVLGVDTVAHPGYPATLFKWDVRELSAADLPEFQLVVASPPCPEFTRHDLPWTRARNPPPPDPTIWRACERIAKEAAAPLVLENVRGAQKWMGPAVAHVGPFYLWGDVPILVPQGRFLKNKHRSPSIRAKIPRELAVWVGRCFLKTAGPLP